METKVDEIADGIFRLSTFAEPYPLAFNQFLIVADEPLLFHTGMRQLFGSVSEAAARVLPLSKLRFITFGHYEADECGAMNEWLAAAPGATVAHGALGVMLSVGDQAARPPRALQNDETIDLGGKRVRYIATPHVPHGWDAGVFYEETTKTLFVGDLFTAAGNGVALTSSDILEPAIAMERNMHATALTPSTAPTIRRLADFDAATLGTMHASAFSGDTRTALNALADFYAGELREAEQEPLAAN